MLVTLYTLNSWKTNQYIKDGIVMKFIWYFLYYFVSFFCITYLIDLVSSFIFTEQEVNAYGNLVSAFIFAILMTPLVPVLKKVEKYRKSKKKK